MIIKSLADFYTRADIREKYGVKDSWIYKVVSENNVPKTIMVFKGLRRAHTREPFKKWLKDAGIKKKITFHGLRHTYATLLISNGTDIYTVSKMLTHKNVATTQIYADVVNQKKRDAANSISLK